MVYIQHNSQYSATSCDNRGNKLHVKFLLKFKYNHLPYYTEYVLQSLTSRESHRRILDIFLLG